MTAINRFDPRQVAALRVDHHLEPVPRQHLRPQALRARFAQPPAWTPEILRELRLLEREPTEAAVLLPLVMRESGLTLLLTERGPHLSTHSGQIAFPGGRRDAADRDLIHTALRETHEEVGLEATFIEVLGSLPTYVTGTAFIITPVVGLVQPGFDLRPNPAEVADVFEVPLDYLMNPAHHRHHQALLAGAQRQFLSMPWTGPDQRERFIWGATAGMLRNFYRFLIS